MVQNVSGKGTSTAKPLIKGYNFFKSGHVVKLEKHLSEDGVCHLRGKILPSMKKSTSYTAFITLRDGKILRAKCGCPAGIEGHCQKSWKLASQSQPIQCKTKTNHDLVTRVFPRFKQVACFYSIFSLANNHGDLFSDWQLSSLWIWFFYTQLKSARWSAVVINLDWVVGHSVEIHFSRIQCYMSVCTYHIKLLKQYQNYK